MLTNFAALTSEQLTAWSRDFWRVARNKSFINKFAGSGANAMVQRISELTKSDKGTRAVFTLIAEATGDGVTGDNTMEGNEEALRAYDMVVNIDQLRFANRIQGRMADQKSVVNFRETSRDLLAYQMADRIDQMAFLTLSGISYASKNNGALRPVLPGIGQNLTDLEFAADVSAPTANRHVRWVAASSSLAAGATASVVATDLLSYRTIVELKTFAKDHYIRGISNGTDEVYHMFVTPRQMAKLKLDADFLANVRNAGVRGMDNSLFAGTNDVMIDGVMIHEFRHVYNTVGAASGSKWGGAGTVDGARALFCGAQALAMADIGAPTMVEDVFDYKNQSGISIGKIFGFKKPKFRSDYDNAVEDFGVICLDTAV